MPNYLYNGYHSKDGAWSNSDYYERVNGKWVKRTAYARQGGKWVKVIPKPPEEENEPVMLAAGLYETGTENLVYSWEQLLGDEILEGGVVHVTDGVLSTNIKKLYGSFSSNGSANVLVGDLVLPDGITEIEKWAFRKCTYLTGIVIQDGVHTLGGALFRDCTALYRVVLPSTLTTMTPDSINGTFRGCTSLESINIPVGVAEIPVCCFADCTSLKEVTLPETLTAIKLGAFSNCTSLAGITFPDGLTSIVNEAFKYCSSLTRIRIPAATEISTCDAFYQCTGIESFELGDGNPYHIVIDGNLYFNDGKKLGNYALGKKATEFVVPEGVTSIDGSAFNGCQYIEKITMPSTLVELYGVAIANCPSLTTLVMKSETPPSTTHDSWLNGTTLSKIIVPVGSVDAYKAAERWSAYADIITESA